MNDREFDDFLSDASALLGVYGAERIGEARQELSRVHDDDSIAFTRDAVQTALTEAGVPEIIVYGVTGELAEYYDEELEEGAHERRN